MKSAKDQIDTLNEKKRINLSSFEKVLEISFHQINIATSLDSCTCLFEVPEFILGYPLYNINECILYVCDKLRKLDYKVNYFFPKLLHISWNASETNEEKKQKMILDIMNHSHSDNRFVPFLQSFFYKQKNHKNEHNLIENKPQSINENKQESTNENKEKENKGTKKKKINKPITDFKNKVTLDLS